MEVNKTYNIELDTKRLTTVSPHGIRVGESGVLFRISLKNDDVVVDLSEADRILLEIQSNIGRHIIDSAVQGDGVIRTTAYAIVPLKDESYAAGLNRCTLRVYTESEICSAEFQFRARA